ncbi:helix-turn-helix domain-containing protein [Halobacillus shinanisalinarum]|uniref:Helix-turn-helix domain-containing protein n=1 Tax=Halobacillus shinanisalinarum TaxID=2932258 RepID=A0ABY4GUR7_9BACI|nr:helix-turn-helix domain-containing protein [Halobacillus shinanisalinarum]UOQ91888.1 helix-turn-helix domain-containing protein [Halobacillus shinanisalinarum]
MGKFKKIKSRLFYKYFVSYLIIFLIPFIAMSVMVYHNSVVSLKEEIEQSNINKLKQVKDMTDTRMKELRKIAARISFDPQLTPYMVSHGYYGSEAIQELEKYKANSSIIEELFLYYQGDDVIYSSKGLNSLETFAQSIYHFDHWKKEELINDLNSIQKPVVLPADNVTINNNDHNRFITYLYPIPPNDPVSHGTVMFLIKESVITGLIENILGEFQENVYIFDEKNRILTSESNGNLINENNFDPLASSESGIHTAEIDDKEYSFVTVNSKVSGWTFVSAMPTSQFLSKFAQAQTLIIMTLLLIVVAGLVAATVLSIKHYRPIQSLFEYVSKKNSDVQGKKKRNELDSLRETIVGMFKDQKDLCEKVDSQEPFVREQCLMRMLKGDVKNNRDFHSWLETLDISVEDRHFFVLVISYNEKANGEGSVKIRESISRLFTEISFKGAVGYGIEIFYDNTVALIVNMESKVGNLNERSREFAFQVKSLLQNDCGVSPTIGVGSICGGIDQINRSFIEASAAVEYKLVNGKSSVIFFGDLVRQEEPDVWYPKDQQIKFVQGLKKGDQKVACEAVKNMIGSLTERELPIHILKCLLFDIINTVLRATAEMGMHQYMSRASELVEYDSLEDLHEKIHSLVIAVCNEVEKKKDSHNHELRSEILEYIRKSYKTHNFSLESTAESFKLSVSYLSRFMKEQTGATFTQYVWQLRSQEVKRRLKETDESIKEIAMGVGYMDVPNFTRKFKKAEGVTPGEFRKLYA